MLFFLSSSSSSDSLLPCRVFFILSQRDDNRREAGMTKREKRILIMFHADHYRNFVSFHISNYEKINKTDHSFIEWKYMLCVMVPKDMWTWCMRHSLVLFKRRGKYLLRHFLRTVRHGQLKGHFVETIIRVLLEMSTFFALRIFFPFFVPYTLWNGSQTWSLTHSFSVV